MLKLDEFEKKYIHLWQRREIVFSLKSEMGWDACFELSNNIHQEISVYFSEIKDLEYNDKIKIYNKLKEISLKLNKEDNLFSRVITNLSGDNSGGTKFLLNVCISTKNALVNGIKLIDFDLRKVNGICNCSLKQEIGLTIQSKPAKDIIKIEKFTDGYYEYELHQCAECKTFWINDLYSDDGPSKGWREPINEYEFTLIKKNLNKE